MRTLSDHIQDMYILADYVMYKFKSIIDRLVEF